MENVTLIVILERAYFHVEASIQNICCFSHASWNEYITISCTTPSPTFIISNNDGLSNCYQWWDIKWYIADNLRSPDINIEIYNVQRGPNKKEIFYNPTYQCYINSMNNTINRIFCHLMCSLLFHIIIPSYCGGQSVPPVYLFILFLNPKPKEY